MKNASDFKRGDSVRYVPRHPNGVCEDGCVSSTNDSFVFVKFHQQVARLGWDGATSQDCDPGALVNLSSSAGRPNGSSVHGVAESVPVSQTTQE